MHFRILMNCTLEKYHVGKVDIAHDLIHKTRFDTRVLWQQGLWRHAVDLAKVSSSQQWQSVFFKDSRHSLLGLGPCSTCNCRGLCGGWTGLQLPLNNIREVSNRMQVSADDTSSLKLKLHLFWFVVDLLYSNPQQSTKNLTSGVWS